MYLCKCADIVLKRKVLIGKAKESTVELLHSTAAESIFMVELMPSRIAQRILLQTVLVKSGLQVNINGCLRTNNGDGDCTQMDSARILKAETIPKRLACDKLTKITSHLGSLSSNDI
jgi:hypothetical protein